MNRVAIYKVCEQGGNIQCVNRVVIYIECVNRVAIHIECEQGGYI